MSGLDHENLVVYEKACALARELEIVAHSIPRGRSDLRSQLRRASASIVLNIAEGAGEFRPAEKARLYRIAKRSANECMGLLDILARIGPAGDPYRPARDELRRVARMVNALAIVHLRRAQEQQDATGAAPAPPPAPSPHERPRS